MDVEILITTDTKKVVIKIMRRRRRRGRQDNGDDSNNLRIDYISGGKSLTFWSRIAARRIHIHQPRCTIYQSTYLVLYLYNTILLLRYYYYTTTVTLLLLL
jgi:hypothetical protein